MTLSPPRPNLGSTSKVATPAIFLALLVSLAMLALISRTRIRSSALVGTLSAVLPLAACGFLAASL
ncbi:hypothetical protein [Micromonospora sp. NPDC005413]|uniref:hypothetical protein n=1 Tax=Micromonospora sp. NPDC005413 TaxID=3154563 RepID=UPI0033BCC51C